MIKYYFKKGIINILLYNNGNITGIIRVFKRTNKQGVLDLFIRTQYRSKWLNKDLYFNLKSKFIDICSKVGYDVVITRLNNIKSIRLLNHFGFMKYNEKYYYLWIS